MRILVMGYSGFLGGHFVRNAQTYEHELVLIGRNSPRIHNQKNILWVKSQLVDLSKNLLSLGEFDVLVNFVWQGLPVRSDELNRVNFEIQAKILSQLDLSRIKKVICLGSCLEYKASINRLSEHSEIETKDNFALTKIGVYKMYQANCKNLVWPRVFYVYGSGQHQKSLLNYAYDAYLNSKPLSLNSPDDINDYIHANEIGRAHV